MIFSQWAIEHYLYLRYAQNFVIHADSKVNNLFQKNNPLWFFLSLLHEGKILWGRSLYCKLSLTSKRGESCKRRMRRLWRYGILSSTYLLAALTERGVSLLHLLSCCKSLLLPSSWVWYLSSLFKAGLVFRTMSKLTQGGKKKSATSKVSVSGELNCITGESDKRQCTGKIRWSGTEQKWAAQLAWISQKFILWDLKWSLQQGTCALEYGQAPLQHLWTVGCWWRRKLVMVRNQCLYNGEYLLLVLSPTFPSTYAASHRPEVGWW